MSKITASAIGESCAVRIPNVCNHDVNTVKECITCKEIKKIELDTHLGSGSHAIACNNLGFELTACELDKDYYQASIKRIKQAAAQERLFA